MLFSNGPTLEVLRSFRSLTDLLNWIEGAIVMVCQT